MNKNKIIYTIIFSIFFILTISAYYNMIKQTEYIEFKHQRSFDTLQQIIDGKIIFFRKQYAARIKNIIHKNKNFKVAILSKDNKKIKNMLDNIYKILKRENRYTKTLQLISPDNISIYRAHKPSKYGDDITLTRPIIAKANQNKRAKYGFEISPYSIAYRVDIPIIYNKINYGILEYGLDTNIFIDDFISVSNYLESAILLKKDLYNNISQNKFQLSDKTISISKKYIVLDNDMFFKNVNIDTIKQNTHFTNNNEHYTAFLYNLLTFNGKSSGTILLAVNMTADAHRYEDMIKISIINQVILIFIIFIIIYYAFNYYENKITKLREIERQNEQVIHQQSKMASMGEMIGNIAHQWRQPLSVISTTASGISVQKEFDIFDEKTLSKSMDLIVSQTQFMSKTIDDFRDFFKSDKEKIKFELNKVIVQNISLVQASLTSNDIDIEFIPTDKKQYLLGYQNELTQSVVNILNNAKDQLIKLPKNTKKIITIKIEDDEKNIYLSIIDNAGGVDEKIIDKIFEPYFTTKHQAQGTGIGLYMTHEIIFKHFHGNVNVVNKQIEYDNQLYSCAVFTITLPKK